MRHWREDADEIPLEKRRLQLKRVRAERRLVAPKWAGPFRVFDIVWNRFFPLSPFLNQDGSVPGNSDYAYPSKLPAFAAQLAIWELDRWGEVSASRKRLSKALQIILDGKNLSIPFGYQSQQVVPLRVAVLGNDTVKTAVARVVDMGWNWFEQPIVAGEKDLTVFGYELGMCPVAERVGKCIITIPCNVPDEWQRDFVQRLRKTLG